MCGFCCARILSKLTPKHSITEICMYQQLRTQAESDTTITVPDAGSAPPPEQNSPRTIESASSFIQLTMAKDDTLDVLSMSGHSKSSSRNRKNPPVQRCITPPSALTRPPRSPRNAPLHHSPAHSQDCSVFISGIPECLHTDHASSNLHHFQEIMK
ncbi:hypothetical protein ACOME3_005034 [Neoechinorhynchus agilis]